MLVACSVAESIYLDSWRDDTDPTQEEAPVPTIKVSIRKRNRPSLGVSVRIAPLLSSVGSHQELEPVSLP